MTKRLRYKRVLLKLSGEAFGSAHAAGIDLAEVDRMAAQIQRVARTVELAVVVGGGNIIRGAKFSERGMNRSTADHMGMIATVINALALQDALERCDVETRVMSAISMEDICEPYIRRRAIRHLEKKRVVILGAGTGNPYFTTDTTAALRATELGAQVLLKATQVDGIYTADPKKDRKATRYETLSYMDVLKGRLKVMDATAISLCMDNALPILVFDSHVPGNIERAARGEKVGTWVGP